MHLGTGRQQAGLNGTNCLLTEAPGGPGGFRLPSLGSRGEGRGGAASGPGAQAAMQGIRRPRGGPRRLAFPFPRLPVLRHGIDVEFEPDLNLKFNEVPH